MGLIARSVDFLRSSPKIGREHADRLAAWKRGPRIELTLPHAQVRYVVVDVETTGLDMRRDTAIAIGALAVSHGVIAFDDGFDVVLRQERASADANILIHGIGGQTQLTGENPAIATLGFVEFAGRSPLVAFRAEFDRTMLERAVRDTLGVALGLPFIDLALLLPSLFRGTACDSLDDWLAHFSVDGAVRHRALGDAYATARLFLIALAAAELAGIGSAAQLLATQKAQRWLGTRR